MSDPMPDFRPSDGLAEFAIFALDHGISSVKHGGTLVPFVMWAREGQECEMQRFDTDSLEEGVKLANEYARTLAGSADGVIVAWDGYLTRDNHRLDAIFAHAFEAGEEASFIFAQQYTPAGGDMPAEPIGNPMLCAIEKPLF